MIGLARLGPAQLHELTGLERTPEAPPWIAEVEQFVLDGGAVLALQAGGGVLSIRDDGELVGAAVHHPHPRYAAQYLAAFLIDVDHRGRGLGSLALAAVIEKILRESDEQYVTWLVHKDNEPMLAMSAALGDADSFLSGDHRGFVHP